MKDTLAQKNTHIIGKMCTSFICRGELVNGGDHSLSASRVSVNPGLSCWFIFSDLDQVPPEISITALLDD